MTAPYASRMLFEQRVAMHGNMLDRGVRRRARRRAVLDFGQKNPPRWWHQKRRLGRGIGAPGWKSRGRLRNARRAARFAAAEARP